MVGEKWGALQVLDDNESNRKARYRKKVYELHLIRCCEIIGPFKDDVLAVTEFEGAVKVTKGDGAKQQVKTF